MNTDLLTVPLMHSHTRTDVACHTKPTISPPGFAQHSVWRYRERRLWEESCQLHARNDVFVIYSVTIITPSFTQTV